MRHSRPKDPSSVNVLSQQGKIERINRLYITSITYCDRIGLKSFKLWCPRNVGQLYTNRTMPYDLSQLKPNILRIRMIPSHKPMYIELLGYPPPYYFFDVRMIRSELEILAKVGDKINTPIYYI